MAILAQDLVGIGFAPVQAEFLANAINAAGGGLQPTTITPLTGMSGTANDAMVDVAALTNSTSTAATITQPAATFDAANVKTVVDAGLATANTNLLAAVNQVVTKANAQITNINADLKDLQGKVNQIITALAS